MDSKNNALLKKIEEIHDKKFKNDKDYLESCKANKDLNPKDYKIESNHKLDEYFNKYGKKLEKGQLLAFKKNELWLMNKKTTYWKIENESDFVYFEVQKNLKPLWISLIAVLAAGAIAGGVTAGVLLSKGNGGSSIEPIPGGKDREPMDITQYVPSFDGLKTMVSDPDNHNVIVGDWINVQLKHQDKDNGVGGLVIDEDADGFLADGECYQQIRIIGFNHKNQSTDANPEGACTFEFKTLLSDENGYSLATYWQDVTNTVGSANNYLDTSIRSALNGTSSGSTKSINWFQKDVGTFSGTYSGKSALSMLPDDLVSTIKEVTKKVYTNPNNTTYMSLTDFTDKLFLLSSMEMGFNSSTSSSQGPEGSTYKYYEGHNTSSSDNIRIKQQVKGTDGASSGAPTNATDGEYAGSKCHFAGYNSGTTGEGGVSWLRSPASDSNAFNVFFDGSISGSNSNIMAYNVAPAFCI